MKYPPIDYTEPFKALAKYEEAGQRLDDGTTAKEITQAILDYDMALAAVGMAWATATEDRNRRLDVYGAISHNSPLMKSLVERYDQRDPRDD